MSKRYFGFYPNRHLWVMSAENPVSLENTKQESISEKRRLMTEVIFEAGSPRCELAVVRDGMILVRLPELEDKIEEENRAIANDITASMGNTRKAWVTYLKLANLIFLFLDSALHGHGRNIYMIEMRELTKLGAYRVSVANKRVQSATDYEIESLASMLRLGYLIEEQYNHFFFLNRFEIADAVFSDVWRHYLEPTFQEGLNESHFEFVAKALSEFNLGNYSVSLALSWNLIEGRVNRLWDSAPNSNVMTSKPQSVFWLIEELKSWGVLAIDEADVIHRFRRSRNRYIHKGIDATNSEAKECLDYIKSNSKEILGLELFINTGGPSMHGM
jgi:hypothetical protein